jgi:HD-GYP domain-containing protein (c-di-GMP phosphodiesterase class II)
MSSQLHDVGKISIRDEILMKPGRLSGEESEEMKTHAAFGREIITRIEEKTKENVFLKYAEVLAGTHHEKWDGTGYPDGLSGLEIPLEGRLMAIVDVYDALTNDRPYKKAYSHEESVKIIKKGMGTHFDPLIAEVFLAHEPDFCNPDLYELSKPMPSAQLNTVFKTISNIVDIRGGSKFGHTERLSKYLKIFVDALLLKDEFCDEVSSWDIDVFLISAQLHDIGKIAVSDVVLNKPGKLTDIEYENAKHHADFGMQIISHMRDSVDDKSLLHHAEALAGSHHEKWDGTGYPRGLKGKGIPLQGRIMAIVDVYDALTNHRPYRDMYAHAEAVDIIKRMSGTHFEPSLVEVFIENEKKLERVK